MRTGIQSEKAAWRCAVGLRQYIPGVTNGSGMLTKKKKWPSALVCQLVCTRFLLPCGPQSERRFWGGSERFDTRDVRWAPDGKGFVLLDRDQFCCAFEVEDEEGT
jgi:hypothetical protein